jgi:hypothetical protein
MTKESSRTENESRIANPYTKACRIANPTRLDNFKSVYSKKILIVYVITVLLSAFLYSCYHSVEYEIESINKIDYLQFTGSHIVAFGFNKYEYIGDSIYFFVSFRDNQWLTDKGSIIEDSSVITKLNNFRMLRKETGLISLHVTNDSVLYFAFKSSSKCTSVLCYNPNRKNIPVKYQLYKENWYKWEPCSE